MLKEIVAGVALLICLDVAVAEQIKTLVPSEHVQASANTLRTSTGFRGLEKHIQVPYGGRVRVWFDMATSPGTIASEPASCFVENGRSFTTTSTAFQSFSIDVATEARGIVSIFCNPGSNSDGDDIVMQLRNFRVGYDIRNVSDAPRVIKD